MIAADVLREVDGYADSFGLGASLDKQAVRNELFAKHALPYTRTAAVLATTLIIAGFCLLTAGHAPQERETPPPPALVATPSRLTLTLTCPAHSRAVLVPSAQTQVQALRLADGRTRFAIKVIRQAFPRFRVACSPTRTLKTRR